MNTNTTNQVEKTKSSESGAIEQLIDSWLNPLDEKENDIIDQWLAPIRNDAAREVVERMVEKHQQELKAAQTPRARLRQKVRHQAALEKRRERVKKAKVTRQAIENAENEQELRDIYDAGAALRHQFENTIRTKGTAKALEVETPVETATKTSDNSAQTTIVGAGTGYWKSFSQNWVVGSVVQISASLAIQSVGAATATALGVSPDLASPFINVTSSVAAALTVSVLQHSSTIVTDPKTGLKQIGRTFVGTCSGALTGEAMANSVVGTFGGRIIGQVVGEKLNAVIFGRVEMPQGVRQTSQTLVANKTLSKAQQNLAMRQREKLQKLAEKNQSGRQQQLKSRLLSWEKMRAPIIAASAVSAIIGAALYVDPATSATALAAAGAGTGRYVLDYLKQLATSTEVQAETLKAAYNHPYLGAILKQSILRRLPLEKLEDATEFVTRKLLQYAPVEKIDAATRRVLKNHVRESIIRELMIEDTLVRVARVSSRQATMYAAEKGIAAVQTNWSSIADAIEDIRVGAKAANDFVVKQLSRLTGESSTAQLVGESMLAAAAAMTRSSATRREEQSNATQKRYTAAERALDEQRIRKLEQQQKLARRLRDEKVSKRVAERAKNSLNRAREMNQAAREELKEALLQDRDVIMQDVWDENFSDSTLNILKDVEAPSIARLVAEAQGFGALAKLGRLGQAAQTVAKVAPTVLDTAKSGAEMLKTATSTARVLGAKDIAKDTTEGSRSRFIRDLDEAMNQLPPMDAVSKEAFLEQLKETAGIHSTSNVGYNIDRATSWSARDAVIKMAGLEPGKEYRQQVSEAIGDVGFGAPLRSAVQSVLGSFFSSSQE